MLMMCLLMTSSIWLSSLITTSLSQDSYLTCLLACPTRSNFLALQMQLAMMLLPLFPPLGHFLSCPVFIKSVGKKLSIINFLYVYSVLSGMQSGFHSGCGCVTATLKKKGSQPSDPDVFLGSSLRRSFSTSDSVTACREKLCSGAGEKEGEASGMH